MAKDDESAQRTALCTFHELPVELTDRQRKCTWYVQGSRCGALREKWPQVITTLARIDSLGPSPTPGEVLGDEARGHRILRVFQNYLLGVWSSCGAPPPFRLSLVGVLLTAAEA